MNSYFTTENKSNARTSCTHNLFVRVSTRTTRNIENLYYGLALNNLTLKSRCITADIFSILVEFRNIGMKLRKRPLSS